ncbi:MAG: nucleotidyltransferase family protein [Ktedonobacteraceae bacterium]|nr:nucleotidyltransferase family protein [Ktedonobacteraceae bacterium]
MHETTSSSSTAAIILAAGSSSRMGEGRHKLQLPLGNRAVLLHGLDAALASQARPIIIVLGHQADQVRILLANYSIHTITIAENPNYMQGMSTSIRVGIQALIDSNDAILRAPTDSALILLGDQPLITQQIIDTLIATRRDTGKRIVTPLYQGKRSSPTLFDASLFPELMQLTGDEGGRRLLERYRADIATVEVGDAMASYDVDTWETYQQVLAEWQRRQEQEAEETS